MPTDADAEDEAAAPPPAPPAVEIVYTVPVDTAADRRDSFRRRRRLSSSASSASGSSDLSPSRRGGLSTDSPSAAAAADALSVSSCSIRRTSISFEPAGDDDWLSGDDEDAGGGGGPGAPVLETGCLRSVSLVVPRRGSSGSGSISDADRRELIESVLTLEGSARSGGTDSILGRMRMALREGEENDRAARRSCCRRLSRLSRRSGDDDGDEEEGGDAEVPRDEPWSESSRLRSTRSRRRGRLVRCARVLAGSLLVVAVLTLVALFYAVDEEDVMAFLHELPLVRRGHPDEEQRSTASVVEPMHAASESYQDEGLEEVLTVVERPSEEAPAFRGLRVQGHWVKVRLHDHRPLKHKGHGASRP